MKKRKQFAILLLIITFFCSKAIYAGIDYTNIADTTIRMPNTINSINYYYLDVNNDGNGDFKIGLKYFESWEGYHPPHNSYIVSVSGIGPNQVNQGPFFANDTIQSNLSFEGYSGISGGVPGIGPIGRWPYFNNDPNVFAYIGLKFTIDSEEHYGWVRIKTDGRSVTIGSYAYGTTKGEMIIAGQIN